MSCFQTQGYPGYFSYRCKCLATTAIAKRYATAAIPCPIGHSTAIKRKDSRRFNHDRREISFDVTQRDSIQTSLVDYSISDEGEDEKSGEVVTISLMKQQQQTSQSSFSATQAASSPELISFNGVHTSCDTEVTSLSYQAHIPSGPAQTRQKITKTSCNTVQMPFFTETTHAHASSKPAAQTRFSTVQMRCNTLRTSGDTDTACLRRNLLQNRFLQDLKSRTATQLSEDGATERQRKELKKTLNRVWKRTRTNEDDEDDHFWDGTPRKRLRFNSCLLQRFSLKRIISSGLEKLRSRRESSKTKRRQQRHGQQPHATTACRTLSLSKTVGDFAKCTDLSVAGDRSKSPSPFKTFVKNGVKYTRC